MASKELFGKDEESGGDVFESLSVVNHDVSVESEAFLGENETEAGAVMEHTDLAGNAPKLVQDDVLRTTVHTDRTCISSDKTQEGMEMTQVETREESKQDGLFESPTAVDSIFDAPPPMSTNSTAANIPLPVSESNAHQADNSVDTARTQIQMKPSDSSKSVSDLFGASVTADAAPFDPSASLFAQSEPVPVSSMDPSPSISNENQVKKTASVSDLFGTPAPGASTVDSLFGGPSLAAPDAFFDRITASGYTESSANQTLPSTGGNPPATSSSFSYDPFAVTSSATHPTSTATWNAGTMQPSHATAASSHVGQGYGAYTEQQSSQTTYSNPYAPPSPQTSVPYIHSGGSYDSSYHPSRASTYPAATQPAYGGQSYTSPQQYSSTVQAGYSNDYASAQATNAPLGYSYDYTAGATTGYTPAQSQGFGYGPTQPTQAYGYDVTTYSQPSIPTQYQQTSSYQPQTYPSHQYGTTPPAPAPSTQNPPDTTSFAYDAPAGFEFKSRKSLVPAASAASFYGSSYGSTSEPPPPVPTATYNTAPPPPPKQSGNFAYDMPADVDFSTIRKKKTHHAMVARESMTQATQQNMAHGQASYGQQSYDSSLAYNASTYNQTTVATHEAQSQSYAIGFDDAVSSIPQPSTSGMPSALSSSYSGYDQNAYGQQQYDASALQQSKPPHSSERHAHYQYDYSTDTAQPSAQVYQGYEQTSNFTMNAESAYGVGGDEFGLQTATDYGQSHTWESTVDTVGVDDVKPTHQSFEYSSAPAAVTGIDTEDVVESHPATNTEVAVDEFGLSKAAATSTYYSYDMHAPPPPRSKPRDRSKDDTLRKAAQMRSALTASYETGYKPPSQASTPRMTAVEGDVEDVDIRDPTMLQSAAGMFSSLIASPNQAQGGFSANNYEQAGMEASVEDLDDLILGGESGMAQHASGEAPASQYDRGVDTTYDQSNVYGDYYSGYDAYGQNTAAYGDSSPYQMGGSHYGGSQHGGYNDYAPNYAPEYSQLPVVDMPEVDPLGRTGCPLVAFGFGGKLITTFPKPVQRFVADQELPVTKLFPGSVHVDNLSDRIQVLSAAPIPLLNDPSSNEKTIRKNALDIIDSKIAEANEILNALDTEEEKEIIDDSIVLWRTVRIMICKEGAAVSECEADIQALLKEANSNSAQPVLSTQGPVAVTPTSENFTSIKNFLLNGEREAAFRYALSHQLWPHALLIASCVGKDAWKEAAGMFIQNDFSSCEAAESLQLIYGLFAGLGKTSVDVTFASHERLGSWKESILAILSNHTPGDATSLCALGDALKATGKIEAAHLWFSGLDMPDVKMVLLGIDHEAADTLRDLENIRMTEVYEIANRKASSKSGIPHLQAFKLAFCWLMLDSGYVQEAERYCEAIANCIKAETSGSPYYHEILVSQLQTLSQRLSGNNGASSGSGNVASSAVSWFSKMPKPTLNSFLSGMERLITGEEEEKKPSVGAAQSPFDFNGPVSMSPGMHPRPGSTDVSNFQMGDYGRPRGSSMGYSGHGARSRHGSRPEQLAVPNKHATTNSPLREYATPNSTYDGVMSSAYYETPYGHSDYDAYSASPHSFASANVHGNVHHDVSERPLETEAASEEPPKKEVSTPSGSGGWFWGRKAPASEQGKDQTPPMSQRERPASMFEADDDDFGFGNRALSKSKPAASDAGDEPASKQRAPNHQRADSESAVKNSDGPSQSGNQGGESGWFRRWFGGGGSGGGSKQASLGEESAFRYDPVLKRWVNTKASDDGSASAPAPLPPPPKADMGSRSSTPASAHSMPPPKPSTPALPPPSSSSALARSVSEAGSGFPPRAGSTPPSTAMDASSSPLPPPRTGGTGRARKPARARYVDVMNQDNAS